MGCLSPLDPDIVLRADGSALAGATRVVRGAKAVGPGATAPARPLGDRTLLNGGMGMNKWIRQIHRWLSIIFTVTVIANFVAMAQASGGMPPAWITYAPLLPLFLLLITGLYLFVLPYTARWRRG
jgi:hypothetical protein